MSATVNIGTLEGLLRWKADDAELNKSLEDVAKRADVSKKQVKQYNREVESLTSAYNRVAASVDPVVANTQKYERAEKSLIAALRAGIITQEQHNRTLAQAKEKYLGNSASTLTWREEMQRLTNVISPFATRLADISTVAKEIQGALLGSASATTTAAGSATAATGAFSGLFAALLPLLPLLAVLAVTAGSVFVAFKGVSFLASTIKEGTQTQLVIERLNNTLKSTGSYAQLSSAQLITLAESYELLSGKSKEEIIAAETILARFQTLNQQTYPEALRVTLAYSKAMGVTADQAASKLGPALEGNTRALGSLKEAGIVLSASQRKTLQTMIDTGDVAQYQATLFEILREKVGDLSNEYDNNLTRQVDRAKIVINDFGESIANQVIPAIEDLVSEIVISLGGWDNLKKKVNEVGGAIGNFIRERIYGLAIAYHELMATMDIFIARHRLLAFTVSVPLKMIGIQPKTQKEASASAVGHAQAILRLTKQYNEHRTALEGNTEVYQSHGAAVDSLTGKTAELDNVTEELTEKYRDNSVELERIYALRMLATKGPLGREDRIAQEAEINQLYKDRLTFLKLEEKFGTAVAKSLMEVEKGLRDLELKAKVELELATKLRPIEVDTKDLFKFADKSFEEATKRLDSIVAIEEKNTEVFLNSQTAYDEWIENIATGWVESFRSMEEVAEGQMFAVRVAVERGLLSAAEGEMALAQIRADLYSAQIDKWGGFVSEVAGQLSQLGGMLGSFFSKLASIAGSVQNVNQTAQSLGGWTSAMGAFGGTVAAFVELYKFADAVIQKHKGEKYGTRSGLSVTGGLGVSSYTTQEGMALSRQIADVLKAFEEQLRISVHDLAAIEIRIRNNGEAVQAWVKGEWIGTFTDVNEAIRAALAEAITDPDSSLRGMSDIMSQALSRWTSPDMEGLISFLGELRTISDLSLSPLVIDLQKSFLAFNQMREALSRLDQSTREVIDAQNDLNKAQTLLFEQTKAQLLGIDLSMSEGIRNLAGFQKGMSDATSTWRQGLESTIRTAQSQLAALERKATGLPTGTGGGQGVAGPREPTTVDPITARLFSGTTEVIDNEINRLKKAITGWQNELAKVPESLTDAEIDLGIFTVMEDAMRRSGRYAGEIAKFEEMRIDAQWQALRLQLVAIGAWDRWATTWQDLYAQAIADVGRAPGTGGRGRGGRGGGGSSDKDNVRDFIRDKKFELSLTGLTEFQRARKEIEQLYEEQLKQAGKDKKLRQELIDLKNRELAQLRDEHKERTRGQFREFLGLVSPFEKVKKTAQDLIKDIAGSPFGNAQKAAMIGRVMADLNRQLDEMSKEMTLSLFGQMVGDLERFGAAESQVSQVRIQMAVLEHTLKMANYAREIAILQAEGRISQEHLAILQGAYDFLAGIDPTILLGGPPDDVANDFSSYSSTSVFDEFDDRLKSVQDKLAEWARVPLSETLSRAHELTDSFSELMEDVNKLIPFGWNYTQIAQETFQKLIRGFVNDTLAEFEESGSELENTLRGIGAKFTDINAAFIHIGATQEELQRMELARLNAVQRALDQYLDPIRERRLSRQVGDRSILTGEQQYANAQSQFRDLFSEIQSGNLENLDQVVGLADQYEDLLRSFTGGEGLRFGLKEIDDTLLAIENLVPSFAQEMAEVGTPENPMSFNQTETVSAIQANMAAVNTGNTLMLAEMRTGVEEMRYQSNRLDSIELALTNPLSVRDIA